MVASLPPNPRPVVHARWPLWGTRRRLCAHHAALCYCQVWPLWVGQLRPSAQRHQRVQRPPAQQASGLRMQLTSSPWWCPLAGPVVRAPSRARRPGSAAQQACAAPSRGSPPTAPCQRATSTCRWSSPTCPSSSPSWARSATWPRLRPTWSTAWTAPTCSTRPPGRAALTSRCRLRGWWTTRSHAASTLSSTPCRSCPRRSATCCPPSRWAPTGATTDCTP
mmetsp:Transcript_34772/g.88063  ORF Transcript_34772/g.88063 Transcript_34772/m.88063 type:complete len:221 (+) Transcript_34772:197-859(+)